MSTFIVVAPGFAIILDLYTYLVLGMLLSKLSISACFMKEIQSAYDAKYHWIYRYLFLLLVCMTLVAFFFPEHIIPADSALRGFWISVLILALSGFAVLIALKINAFIEHLDWAIRMGRLSSSQGAIVDVQVGDANPRISILDTLNETREFRVSDMSLLDAVSMADWKNVIVFHDKPNNAASLPCVYYMAPM